MLTLRKVTLEFSPYPEHSGRRWSRDCTTPAKLDSVSTLTVMTPARQVAVTIGENTEENGDDDDDDEDDDLWDRHTCNIKKGSFF